MFDNTLYTTFIVPLARGDFDNDLDWIIKSVRNRKDAIAPTVDDFQVGERVVLNQNVNPKYLQGANATIRKINRTKVVIDLDHQQGRFYKGITTPTSMLSKA